MFLAKPDFLIDSLHVITVIATPLHVFGTYCIFFKTPKTMNSVKWPLFNLHFWCMFLDWGFTVLSIPLLIFPVMGGYPLGILTNWFGMSTLVQIYLIITLIFMVCTSIVVAFENRYYQLYGKKQVWRYIRIPFIIINYLLTVTFLIPACLNVPDQRMALERTYQLIPNLPEEIKSGPIFILAEEYFWVLVPFNSMAVIEVVESFLFIGLINRNMKSSSRQMTLSENTMKLQKKFMRALYAQVKNLKILKMIFLFQVTVFLLNFQVPIVYILYSVTSNFYSQEANNLVFIVASLHGINSTLIMLFAHKPYRAECEKMIMSGREFFKIPPRTVGSRTQRTRVSSTIVSF
ncbi:hypothetical protein CRE_16134 [Caenorhabditis remanei]|uniref:Serpentine Receptor, class H n=1 Tax=Caenorhabditis remanei TaxID=31234 RepID=E3MB80_CAERE|nr:hypothetical protein CRE_16134 [Caenorhabditis remanei]